jgi:Tol biopolymer transport system component
MTDTAHPTPEDDTARDELFERLGRMAGQAVRSAADEQLLRRVTTVGGRRRVARTTGSAVAIIALAAISVFALARWKAHEPPPATPVPPRHVHFSDTFVGQGTLDTSYAIYVYDNAGQKVRRVDPDGGHATNPDVSPDGRQVAYTSDDGSIWIANTDGAAPRQLLKCSTDCTAYDDPAFSASGDQLAFTTRTGTGSAGSSTVGVLDVDTGRTRTVEAFKGGKVARRPRWSPDGRRLAVEIDSVDTSGDTTSSTLIELGLDGKPVPLPLIANHAEPDWSWATGALVASNRDDGNLYTVDTKGSHRLTDVTAGQQLSSPTWAVDGRSIIAVLTEAGITYGVRVDAASGAITRIGTTFGPVIREIPALDVVP